MAKPPPSRTTQTAVVVDPAEAALDAKMKRMKRQVELATLEALFYSSRASVLEAQVRLVDAQADFDKRSSKTA